MKQRNNLILCLQAAAAECFFEPVEEAPDFIPLLPFGLTLADGRVILLYSDDMSFIRWAEKS